MAVKILKPTSNARRGMSVDDFSDITKKKPEKSLTNVMKNNAGRNSQGKITVRHRGGGARRAYRLVDFKLKGNDLYDNHSHKVEILKDNSIYDDHSHKVCTINGNDIYNDHSHKIVTIRGTDIYDEHGHKIATISDIKKQIDGAIGGTSLAALWFCFIR